MSVLIDNTLPGDRSGPADVPLKAPRCPRYGALDLWRGFACLLVLVNHSCFYEPSPGQPVGRMNAGLQSIALRLWAGVPIFFVISGYCICATADSTRRNGNVGFSYFQRRFRRILPPYWAVLGMTCLLVAVIDTAFAVPILSRHQIFLRPWWYSGWQWAGSLSLTETWRYHFIGGQKGLILGHAWTLCYEEQFYLVIGIFLILVPRRLFWAAGLTSVLTVVAVAVGYDSGLPIHGFFLDGAWLLFGCGILAYHQINYAGRRQTVFGYAALGLGLAWSARDVSRLLEADKNFDQSLFVATAFTLGILAVHRWDACIMNSRLSQPLMFCGRMCYSLYLVHLPVCMLIHAILLDAGIAADQMAPVWTVLLCAAASIPLAWLFYLGVERHFLNVSQCLRK
jgi:peptidoglycan/LPS O-acetylase OafA/YrhL